MFYKLFFDVGSSRQSEVTLFNRGIKADNKRKLKLKISNVLSAATYVENFLGSKIVRPEVGIRGFEVSRHCSL